MSMSMSMSVSPCPEVPMPASPKKTGRPPNEDYMKLMGPDEDWRKVADGGERRKIQNRLAQRAYRRNLREKNKEVEKLKQKLRKFEGTTTTTTISSSCHGRSSNCSDASVSGSCPDTETYRVQSPGSSGRSTRHSAAVEHLESDTSDDLNFTLQDFHTDLDDLDSEFALNLDFDASNLGSNSSYNSAATVLQLPSTPDDRRRSSSPFIKLPELEIFPPSNGAGFNSDFQDLGMDSNNPSSDLIGIMNGNFLGSFTTPFQSPFLQLPIESMLQDPDPSLNKQRTEPNSQWSPDSDASLLHFAVAGGQIETLRLLLQHHRAALDIRDSEGYTPLQRAIMLGRTDMVATMLHFDYKDLTTPPEAVC